MIIVRNKSNRNTARFEKRSEAIEYFKLRGFKKGSWINKNTQVYLDIQILPGLYWESFQPLEMGVKEVEVIEEYYVEYTGINKLLVFFYRLI